MTERPRRRSPRATIQEWPASYLDEDEPWSNWQDCYVLDISTSGMAIEVFGSAREKLAGHRLVVQVNVSEGRFLGVRLTGVVKNLSPGQWSGIRAGIKFTGLSQDERLVLGVMEQLVRSRHGELVSPAAS